MKTIFVIIMSGLLISACSSKPAKIAGIDTSKKTSSEENSITYNTTEPATYEEYRQWRKNNDPASEAYADYKGWVIKYRKWKLEQESL
ncbi:MAG: hypothetical protein ACJA0C_000547 [Candidatus Endobugula sp.]